jgi:hypothetical protein
MTGKALKIITVLVFTFTALGIGCLVFLPGDIFSSAPASSGQTRLVIPQTPLPGANREWGTDPAAYADTLLPALPLEPGAVVTAVLTRNFDDDPSDEYIIASRNLLEPESPVHIVYIDNDPSLGEYKRIWSVPTGASRPGPVSLSTMDMMGDRGICILLYGRNDAGEETLTVLRKNDFPPASERSAAEPPFDKIGELRIDGSISVPEGSSPGQSRSIVAYGRDQESSNALDRVEITYTYNPVKGLYEQSRHTKIPGAQIEQRRIQELLNGNPREFEQYIDGLWYFVDSQGQMEQEQYIYFDYPEREIIFYEDETEQIFVWQNSTPIRYGLYLSSQNSSVTTLKRFIVIELESLDVLRIRVTEDVRLKIGINAPWDGVYRRVRSAEGPTEDLNSLPFRIEAVYEGSIGKLTFTDNGTYELSHITSPQTGTYTFFNIDKETFLELRPGNSGTDRDMYQVQYTQEGSEIPPRTLSLTRIRLGAQGIRSLHEPVISLTMTEKTLFVSTDTPPDERAGDS